MKCPSIHGQCQMMFEFREMKIETNTKDRSMTTGKQQFIRKKRRERERGR